MTGGDDTTDGGVGFDTVVIASTRQCAVLHEFHSRWFRPCVCYQDEDWCFGGKNYR